MFTAIAAQAELIVIANKSVTQSTLTGQDIKDIFLGNKQYWNDKSKISVAALSEGDTAKSFFKTYLGMSPKKYGGMWDEKLYTGGKLSPRLFKNSKQLIDFITQTSGAIGFIDSSSPAIDVIVVDVK
jgi:ABC-type phosphate transport system substrate-binding protein